jgi:hypothetical protein
MTWFRIGIALVVLVGVAGARYLLGWQRPIGSLFPVAETPELILLNGVIYTGDPTHPRAEAMAIRGGVISAVGTTTEIQKLANSQTQAVDLHGAFAMPGFNDAHTHIGSAGEAKLSIDLEGAKSLTEFQQRIRARLAELKPGEWVTGRGWDHTLWPEKRFPSRGDLDAVSKDHPMEFERVDGHVLVANSLALKLAGITKDTKDPPGGSIERDANGEPDGMLKENAEGLVTGKIPPRTAERRRKGIELALADALSHGVTSLQDNSSWDDFLTYRAIKNDGKLNVRITEWLPFAAPLEQLQKMRDEGGTTDPWLKTGALKMVVDGSLGSRTAAMLAAYSDDPKTSGILRMEPERLKQLSIERDKAGFQLAFHAIGDRTNRVALDAFEAAAAANGPRERRDRIEHAQIVSPEDFARYAKLHVIASMQPSHETTDMRWAESRLGAERSKGAYAWKTFLKLGVALAFGTDYPVEVINPMRGLHACVTRELPDGTPQGGWEPQEKISMDECIAAYTYGSAYAEFEEGQKGRIAPGQFADIIVLSADVTKVAPSEILKTEVLRTYVGGKLVYEMRDPNQSRRDPH